MIDSSELVAERQDSKDLAFGAPAFYVVSQKKLAVLYIATLGGYSVYWFYKNWSNYKSRPSGDRSIWPVPRAIFSIFFTHALFREIKAFGHDKARLAEWHNESHATKLVLTMIVSNALDRASLRSIGSPYTDLASFLILAPLLTLFLDAQHMTNASCGDPKGDSNSRFTKANYAWIGVGVIMWILILVGTFLPE